MVAAVVAAVAMPMVLSWLVPVRPVSISVAAVSEAIAVAVAILPATTVAGRGFPDVDPGSAFYMVGHVGGRQSL
jgi:hypothetical protein